VHVIFTAYAMSGVILTNYTIHLSFVLILVGQLFC